KPEGGIAKSRTQLKDAPGTDHAGDLVADAAGHGADNGEVFLAGPGLHLRQQRIAMVSQLVQVGADGRIDQIHRVASSRSVGKPGRRLRIGPPQSRLSPAAAAAPAPDAP